MYIDFYFKEAISYLIILLLHHYYLMYFLSKNNNVLTHFLSKIKFFKNIKLILSKSIYHN